MSIIMSKTLMNGVSQLSSDILTSLLIKNIVSLLSIAAYLWYKESVQGTSPFTIR